MVIYQTKSLYERPCCHLKSQDHEYRSHRNTTPVQSTFLHTWRWQIVKICCSASGQFAAVISKDSPHLFSVWNFSNHSCQHYKYSKRLFVRKIDRNVNNGPYMSSIVKEGKYGYAYTLNKYFSETKQAEGLCGDRFFMQFLKFMQMSWNKLMFFDIEECEFSNLAISLIVLALGTTTQASRMY